MKTPQTDDIARGNHVVPTEWAQQLERERDDARAALERIAHASMVARSLEEDFAEWEKAIEMLLDLLKKEAQ
jgi:hypothetical protein